jgi:hypothetical protein
MGTYKFVVTKSVDYTIVADHAWVRPRADRRKTLILRPLMVDGTARDALAFLLLSRVEKQGGGTVLASRTFGRLAGGGV